MMARVRRNSIQLISSLKAEIVFGSEDATRAIPNMGGFQLGLNVDGLYGRFGESVDEENVVLLFRYWFMMKEVSGFGIGEVALSTLDVLQRFGFFLQMGFTLILATLDGLDVGLLGDVIDEDDCDDDG
ncbi:hypothetical protein Tco_0554773 [Tanacetum coccineum]